MTGEEATQQAEETKKKGKGCLGWLWRLALVGLVVLVGLLVWINSPGMRWAGPKVAKHFFEKAKMKGDLRLGGTLLSGVKIYDLDITAAEGALAHVSVDRLETDYRFMEVIKGKVRGVSGEGIRVEMRSVAKVDEAKPPVDFAALGKTLNGVRGQVLPLVLDLKKVSFLMTKDGKRLVELENSDFSHAAGDEEFHLALGRVIAPDGKFTQKQKAKLVWVEGRLTLDKLELLPIVGVRDVSVALPEDGAIAANLDLRLGDALLRLDVSPGIKDVRVDLVEGELNFGKILSAFALDLPMTGRVTSLSVGMEKVFPEWQMAVGTAEFFVEGFSYDGWNVPEASLGLKLDEGAFSGKIAGKAMGTGLTITAGGDFKREDVVAGKFSVEKIAGDVEVDKLEELLVALDGKLDLPVEFTAFPESTVGGTWAVNFGEAGFASAEGDLTMKAKTADATPIRLKGGYEPDMVTVESLQADGMEFSGKYNLGAQTYEGKQTLKGFDSAGIVPWIKGIGQEVPGTAVVSMDWEAEGSFAENVNAGEIKGLDMVWKWTEPEEGEARPLIAAKADGINYTWPGTVVVKGLVAETQGQTVKLDALLEKRVLILKKFLWMDGQEELAEAAGKLPVPADFFKFKEFIAESKEPLDLKIESRTLPISKLRPWVKGLEQLDDRTSGKLDLAISGSLAEPVVEAKVEIKDISSPSQPEVPTTDLTVEMNAKDGVAKISASAVAPDYAPATLEAEMPFLPKKWAEDPESLKSESITGTLDLPRIELSRFQSLIPGAEELGGVAEGKVTVGGTVGEPIVDGALTLNGGKFRMDNETIPALDGIDIDIGTDLNVVTIKGGVRDVEGGNLSINGTLGLKNETGEGFGNLDVSVKASGMPVVRNEFIIVRANADLNVKGTMNDSRVTGEVGIIDSVFYKDMELIPIGKPFLEPSSAALPSVDAPKKMGSAIPAPFRDWTADVVVKTIDPILIRGNLGKGQVEVALRIEGKLGDPKPNGKVRISETVARLPFSTLEINEGFLTFTPETGFDPILEIRGTAEPRPYRVEAYAYGRASDPQLVLTSQPPLPENEIMTLLATGTTSAGLEDSQAASSRALQLLIEELRRGRFLFGKQLRPVLGLLDNVDFSLAEADPYDSAAYNSATLKLSERWYISAGLGAEGDQRVLGIWRLRFR